MSECIIFGDLEGGGMTTIYSNATFIEDDVAPMPGIFTEDLLYFLDEEVSKQYSGEVWVIHTGDEITRFSYETEDEDDIERAEEIKQYIHTLIGEFRRYRFH